MSSYYWQQVRYSLFLLSGKGLRQEFTSFEALYRFCSKNNIDAKQV